MPLPTSASRRRAAPASALVATVLLAACGGGGGDAGGGPVVPAVTSVTTTAPSYGRVLTITIGGTGLEGGSINVSSAGCRNLARGGTSTSTLAVYTCTVSAVGAQQVQVRDNANATLGSAAYTVQPPQVTLTIASNTPAANGQAVVTLDPARAPVTVDNFLAYVNADFYDGLVFHRVFPNFVIQGGGYPPINGLPVPPPKATNPPIALEVGRGLSNVRYTIAMARTNQADSATSQFFINTVDNVSLDTLNGGYAVFGAVTGNTALVDAIGASPCAPIANFSECVPNPNIVITSARQTR